MSLIFATVIAGSSPLARGLHLRHARKCSRRGIIPARAGFTRHHRHSQAPEWDHPRSRGVYPSARFSRRLISGSSPLARGLHRRRVQDRMNRGIIPARAGFTRRPMSWPISRPDHPRSRGVYSTPDAFKVSSVGSSPLARGLRPVHGGLLQPTRIIPARAGFTPSGPPRSSSGWDHPRSRGVYPICFATSFRWAGSSPLARGLQSSKVFVRHSIGIIPARAGFTKAHPQA